MEKKMQLRFETEIIDMLCYDFTEKRGDYANGEMELFMNALHQWIENAAMDFAAELGIDYTPVYGG